MWCATYLRRAPSDAFGQIARLPLNGRYRFPQEQSAKRKVMESNVLAALPAAPRHAKRHATHLALMEIDHPAVSDSTELTSSLTPTPKEGNSPSQVGDEDVVLDNFYEEQLRSVSASARRGSLHENHPAMHGVGGDVIDLVTDAFREERERLVKKRRRVLFDLTHPNPGDYTYKNKLVPPPPLSFGKVTQEARKLGNKVMLEQHYSLVKQAGTRRDSSLDTRRGKHVTLYDNHNYFFELNELYQEIVLVGRACAGKSSLLNALLGQRVAKTSSTPHTTRQISFYQSVSPDELQHFLNVKGNRLVKLPGGGLQLTFVDVPGFGMEGMSEQWRDKTIELTDAYLGVRRSVNTVLFCIDCERGLTKTDIKYFEWLENLHGVFFVVLTKCDSVPHSRICSVMRQIYVTITKYRRKYRKVFPFIIPTSAKDGTNMEFLRGLLAETSGLIPGDRLRQMLKSQANSEMEDALRAESERLHEVRRIEKEKAKTFFLGTSTSHTPTSSDPTPSVTEAAPSTTRRKKVTRHYTFSLNGKNKKPFEGCGGNRDEVDIAGEDTFGSLLLSNTPREEKASLTRESEEWDWSNDEERVARSMRRHRFLSWRHANPLPRHESSYGARFRLNTGLENRNACEIHLPYTEEIQHSAADALKDNDTEGGKKKMDEFDDNTTESNLNISSSSSLPSSSAASANTFSAIIGLRGESMLRREEPLRHTGGVSRFLNVFEQYAQGGATSRRLSRREESKEARWCERFDNKAITQFLVEETDGRLAEYKGGQKLSPSLVNANSLETRKAQWAAQQYARKAIAAVPEAPWAALDVLRRRAERVKQQAAMRGMSKKDLKAYMRNAGRVTERFERFESEVTTSKYMNEVRQAPTLRGQQQMHLNSTAKISYRSMPVGLWKHYGQRETYWPTPRVFGRVEADKSDISSFKSKNEEKKWVSDVDKKIKE